MSWLTRIMLAPVRSKPFEQFDDARPVVCVDSEGRLVGDEQGGREHQRAHDRDPLPLTLRKLVRILLELRERQRNDIHHFCDLAAELLSVEVFGAFADRLQQNVADVQLGGQRRPGVLREKPLRVR